jgi:septum formation protein
MKMILASSSPRRREILALLGLAFDVVTPQFDEVALAHQPIEDEVSKFAAGKAASVAENHPESLIIGSDTMILLSERKIGKPIGIVDAKQILQSLSGKTHRIFTSVVILDGLGGPGLSAVEEVSVKMRDYSDEEIDRYLSCSESLDKAGAYSIQGAGGALIESIRGDYLAAVGLPLKPIADYLRSRGIKFPLNIERLYSDKAFLNWRSF